MENMKNINVSKDVASSLSHLRTHAEFQIFSSVLYSVLYVAMKFTYCVSSRLKDSCEIIL